MKIIETLEVREWQQLPSWNVTAMEAGEVKSPRVNREYEGRSISKSNIYR